MKAKVLEINQNEIKYKKCDFQDGPTYSAQREHVALIKYKNGVHEKLGEEDVVSQQPIQREPINLADSCALIVTTDSMLIKGRIIEIRQDVIKYRYCDSRIKNIYVIKRNFVSKVLVSNGTVDVLSDINNRNTTASGGGAQTFHKSALAAMVLGIASFPSTYFGFVPAIIAIILGLRVYKAMNENPGRFKESSRSMAKVGIICGAIYLALLLAIIALIVALI